MSPGKRQTGERRLGMSVEFPLADNEGRHVLRNRRDGVDRRKSVAALDELLILLSQLSSEDPERKQ